MPIDQVPRQRMLRSLGDTTSLSRRGCAFAARHLVVTDNNATPHLLVVDVTTGRVTDRYGRHGRGPEEYSTPTWLGPVAGSDDQVVVFDRTNRRVDHVRIDASGKATVLRRSTMPPTVPTYLLALQPVANGFVGGGFIDKGSLVLIDTLRGTVTPAGPPLFEEADLPPGVDRGATSWSHVDIASPSQRVAVAFHSANRIDVFSSTGAFQGSMIGPREPSLHFRQSPQAGGRIERAPESEFGYLSGAVTEDFVYGLYSGFSGESARFARLVHVFSWDGSFVSEFALDRDVFFISVNPQNNRLFGATWEPDATIGEWEIPFLRR